MKSPGHFKVGPLVGEGSEQIPDHLFTFYCYPNACLFSSCLISLSLHLQAAHTFHGIVKKHVKFHLL